MANEVTIGVVGAGSWGLALSRRLALKDRDVLVWVYDRAEYEELQSTQKSVDFGSGVTLPENIRYTMDFSDFGDRNLLVMAVPSHAMRPVATQINDHQLLPDLIVNVAKGIENATLKRMSQVLLEEIEGLNPSNLVTLSGPSHAEEVSRDVPTAVVAASESLESAEQVQEIFLNESFRVYTNQDIIGVELGGSTKNVIAIAAGILDGMEYGDNPKAGLMTRGIMEITRLGVSLGAREETFSGLSGIGDLIVTCLSQHSRNRYVGEQIGRGRKVEEIISEMKMVAEGVKTTESVHQLAENHGIDMPITREVYKVLFHEKSPVSALHDLMTREPVPERHSL